MFGLMGVRTHEGTGRALLPTDLALVHDRGFAFHAAACAPGIVDLLAAVRARDGLVLEATPTIGLSGG